jgi:hypothetical protein
MAHISWRTDHLYEQNNKINQILLKFFKFDLIET